MLYIHRYKILSRTYEIVLCILSLSYDKLNKTVIRIKLEEIRKDNDITELKKTQVYDLQKYTGAKDPHPIRSRSLTATRFGFRSCDLFRFRILGTSLVLLS